MTGQPRGRGHDRARQLAVARADGLLAPADEAWLADHLGHCDACAVVAAEYEGQHALFEELRAWRPEPPRDLWARTSAALDAERGRGGRRDPWRRPRRGPSSPRRRSFAPVAAGVLTLALVGVSLLGVSSLVPGESSAGPTPIAVAAAADVQVIVRGADGNLQVLSRPVDQVCPVSVSSCGAQPTFSVTSAVSGDWSATGLVGAMSPTGGQMVVVAKSSGADGVYVIPVKRPAAAPGQPAGSGAMSSASPSGAVSATASPARPSARPRTPTATSAARPRKSASAPATEATARPGASPALTPFDSPVPSGVAPSAVPASALPGASDAAPAGSGSTLASGAATGSGSPAGTPATLQPAPETATQIASGITVVGSPVYAPGGGSLAFAARPSDDATGPDIYVWSPGDVAARAVTSDHASWLAGWAASGILVSRVVGGVPSTYLLDLATGLSAEVGGPGTWLPAVSPDGTMAVWWSGTVRLAPDGLSWVPDLGQLVVGGWSGVPTGPYEPAPPASPPAIAPSAGPPASGLPATPSPTPTPTPSPAPTPTPSPAPTPTPSPTPTPTPDPASLTAPFVGVGSPVWASPSADATPAPQPLVAAPPVGWQARWSDDGGALAIWTAAQDGSPDGQLSLYRLDPLTHMPDLGSPMLGATPASPDFSLRAGRLVWTSSADDAAGVVDVLAWSGAVYGRIAMPAMGVGTVLP